MSITRDFKLNLVAGRSVPLVINANQYDHGEIWRFTLLDENGQKYSPSTGSIIGLKSDGHIIANAGTVSSTGLVIIPETEQMTAAVGKNIFELLIDDDTHGTANFIVFVEPRPGADGTPSDSDLAVFQEAIDAAATIGDVVDLVDDVTVLSARMDEFARLPDGSLSTAADAELVDIRVGADGTTYQTAGDAVRGQVSDLKNALTDITGEEILQFVSGKYIITNGATVDITDIRTESSYAYAISDCNAGDKFTIWGKGGGSPRLWCFIDASGNSLSVAYESMTLSGAVIVAPATANKLIVNINVSYEHKVYKGVNITKRIDENESLILCTKNAIGTDGNSLTATAISDWKYYDFRMYAGCPYVITISNFTGTAYVQFVDKNGTTIYQKEVTTNSTFNYTFNVDIYQLKVYTASGCTISETHTGAYASHIPEYSTKDNTSHIVTVGKDGTKDHYTIGQALSAIRDSAIYNQYEVVVYPGVYNENNLVLPDYVHVHGIQANLVTVDSTGLDTTYSVFDLKKHVKLSNLRILSKTKYCIHVDSELNNGTVICEGLYCEKLSGGNANTSVVGIGAWKNGSLLVFRGCTFVNGAVGAHTNYDTSDIDNTRLVFDGCTFVSSRIELGLAAGLGNNICEINGMKADRNTPSMMIFYNDYRIVDEPDTYYALPLNWNVIGHSNDCFLPDITNTRHGLMVEALDYNKPISISGTAVDALFGVTKVKGASTIIKGAVYGSLRVDDAQAGAGTAERPYVDRFQMWKRLGDCSGTNKTLTVTVDGVSETYTFNQNYTSSKPTEETLLAAINAVITNAVVSAYSPDCFEMINTTDKAYVKVNEPNGITKGTFVRYDGYKAGANSNKRLIKGIALEDGVKNEYIQVWCGNAMKYTGENGDYGIGSDGKLSAAATEKIGYISYNRFYMYAY